MAGISGKIKFNSAGFKIGRGYELTENMHMSYVYENGRWLFSVNGLSNEALEIIRNRKRLCIQIHRHSHNAKEWKYSHEVNGFPGRYDIMKFSSTGFQNMDLTDWVNGIIYHHGALSLKIKKGIIINILGDDSGEGYESSGVYYSSLEFVLGIPDVSHQAADTGRTGNVYVLATSPTLYLNYMNQMNPIETNHEWDDSETINVYEL